jgi:hypothetical protein
MGKACNSFIETPVFMFAFKLPLIKWLLKLLSLLERVLEEE